MFIVRTCTRRHKGKDYFAFRLRQRRWVAGQTRVRTLLHLGSTYHMPQEQWPEITSCLSILLRHRGSTAGLPQLVPFDPAVRAEADRIHLMLQAKEAAVAPTFAAAGVAEQEADGPASVLINRVNILSTGHSPSVTVEPERLALRALGQLGLEGLLYKRGWRRDKARLAMAAVAARMIASASERETSRWLQHNSALPELLQLKPSAVSLNRLYRCADRLLEHKEALEQGLFAKAQGCSGSSRPSCCTT